MNLAILGFGTVGSGIYEIIERRETALIKQLQVSHILIRKGKEKTLPCMCEDIEVILQDEDCDAVMECMGGIEPAHTYILAALNSGKHVITANKAVVAEYLKEFHEAAAKNGVSFFYEASTGGGIPWIQSLEKAMRIDEISEISGIFNGTSNYILDHMERYGADFDEILAQAQQMGYAEADPSADIDGIDICNKLRISLSIACNTHIARDFPVYGIRHIRKQDIDAFQQMGYAIRLLAKSVLRKDSYCCMVEPTLLHPQELEANTLDNYNIISLYGSTIGNLKFYGQGAGKLPTANAMLQDALDILENRAHLKQSFDAELFYDGDMVKQDYLLRTNADMSGCPYPHTKQEGYYRFTRISVKDMQQVMQMVQKQDAQAFVAAIRE